MLYWAKVYPQFAEDQDVNTKVYCAIDEHFERRRRLIPTDRVSDSLPIESIYHRAMEALTRSS
jgi:hypothetical protein